MSCTVLAEEHTVVVGDKHHSGTLHTHTGDEDCGVVSRTFQWEYWEPNRFSTRFPGSISKYMDVCEICEIRERNYEHWRGREREDSKRTERPSTQNVSLLRSAFVFVGCCVY